MKKKNLILTVVSTLLLGLVIGFFTSGRMAHARMNRMHIEINSPNAVKQHLVKNLQLTEEQLTQISPILDTMLPAQIAMRQSHRKEMDALRDSMFAAISPVLSTAQLQEVAKMKERKGPPRPPR